MELKEWYSKDKKADLLHDIMCMANNLENTDSFIILGIDEENSYKVKSVSDDSNRMNTQKLVDFIRSKKFAGGIRPTVYIQAVNFTTGKIDVIVIKNNYYMPFYLTENYRDVYANNIYTRVMDTSTPKNMSAEIHYVEYLWKRRVV